MINIFNNKEQNLKIKSNQDKKKIKIKLIMSKLIQSHNTKKKNKRKNRQLNDDYMIYMIRVYLLKLGISNNFIYDNERVHHVH